MTDSIYQKLAEILPDLKRDEPLARHSTIRVGGPAAAFLTVNSIDRLVLAVKTAKENKIPYHLLGGGSNTLFSDTGFDGLIIKNMANQLVIGGESEVVEAVDYHVPVGRPRYESADPGKYVSFFDLDAPERPGDTLVTADSGLNLTACIIKTLAADLSGLQWFGGIPGVIGGAVYNNIHGGNRFIADRVAEVRVLTEEGQIKKLPKKDLEFDYDFSRFHRTKEIILSVDFLLAKASEPELERAEYTFREWTRRKSQKQPKLASMGSTFQNIPGAVRERIGAPTTAAGWLIDQCGLKGRRCGGAQIAPEHGNFITNTGNATATDVYSLMQLMTSEVKRRFGVDLVPEVFLVGDFTALGPLGSQP